MWRPRSIFPAAFQVQPVTNATGRYDRSGVDLLHPALNLPNPVGKAVCREPCFGSSPHLMVIRLEHPSKCRFPHKVRRSFGADGCLDPILQIIGHYENGVANLKRFDRSRLEWRIIVRLVLEHPASDKDATDVF